LRDHHVASADLAMWRIVMTTLLDKKRSVIGNLQDADVTRRVKKFI
jgi:hypothetical protein